MSDIGADLQRAFDEGYEKGKADRPQGEWVEEVNDEGEFIRSWHCSNCYYSTGFYTTMVSDFCPKCGADMRGDNDEK